ncbi:MAG: TIGR01440 family protein [Parasporobacterium sp.]|nr:TIGR01440 family protein [Parasporobacterium sp.]
MDIRQEAYDAACEFIKKSGLRAGKLMVIGCSTSEAAGERIGTSSVPEIAGEIFEGIRVAAQEYGIELAAQCCEHLNRALVVERDTAEERGYEEVNVIPWPKAGGSFATMAYKGFEDPVLVEHIKADGGMDIGDTLIGMHLKDVAVPLRLSMDKIGEAHLVCAYSRPKLIGGERAHYGEEWDAAILC